MDSITHWTKKLKTTLPDGIYTATVVYAGLFHGLRLWRLYSEIRWVVKIDGFDDVVLDKTVRVSDATLTEIRRDLSVCGVDVKHLTDLSLALEQAQGANIHIEKHTSPDGKVGIRFFHLQPPSGGSSVMEPEEPTVRKSRTTHLTND